ncbi:MAG: 16S rRNA (guanine(966)-N(2))-methyltransferase RsmD [Oscillospiraceae bacterium]|nr:16S rRNA (guanine(966)-N(2))-methyltransferase RsmD [Oscillospiraceae bacterium]
MRVISGTARGTKLESLEGLSTRPTIDRVKEGIFSSIQFAVPAAKVLDLFAGSGQMGIECLSRGAAQCVFVDSNRDAVNVVIKNIKACGLFDKARVVNMSAQDYLRTSKDEFDIVFLDPPYNMGILDEIIEKVYQITSPGGIIMAESELGWELKNKVEGLTEVKKFKYGKVLVTKFVKETDL